MKQFFLFFFLMCTGLLAASQNLTVKGTVTGQEDGEPLIGATVQVKQRPVVAAVTDIDGNYIIKVSEGETLRFSYVGCVPQEVKVTASGEINVVLAGETSLDEVVVIGYGTAKKSDLTGAVSSIQGDKLQKTPASSLANALQGQAAGVTVNSLSGRPGAAPQVRIRGVGTINGADPIYVVDGVITDDISFLSPNDIEHTEILKDASATAIYGSRGANGVVMVTTKNGKQADRATITLDAYFGWQSRWKKLDVMNARDFAEAYIDINTPGLRSFYEEKGFNAWVSTLKMGVRPYYATVYDPVTNPTGLDYSQIDTDWQDEVFRTGKIQNYHLAVDGGGDKFTYSMSGSWFGQEGILIGSNYSRFTGRLNTSYKATPWLKIGENISFTSSVAKNAYESGDNGSSPLSNILSAAFAMAPWDPARYPEGSVNRDGKDLSNQISASSNFWNSNNPLSMVEYSHPKVRNERWIGNVFAEIYPVKYLTFRSTFSFDYRLTTDKSFREAYLISDYDRMDENFLTSSMARTFNWNVDNILTYARTIGKHDFSVMAGQTVEEYNYYAIGNSGGHILNPVEKNWFLSQVTENFGRPGDTVSRSRRFSWLGRVQYNFDGRYLATVNFRADGSSKFRDNAWGYFPSFSLAWRLSSESFLRDTQWLNNLKLRFGWGKVGNDKIGDDAFVLNMFNTGPTFVDYVFGQNQALANGATVLTWINQGGKWESTEQYSLGVDFGFFNNRLSGSIDGFIRNTSDMLMTVTAPAYVGNRYAGSANVGKVRNRGIEISLEHRNDVGRDFSYSIGGNISFIDNKLTHLNGGAPIYQYAGEESIQAVNEGHSLYYFTGYEYMGIYKSDQEVLDYLTGYNASTTPFHAGDAKYRDLNGDGIIDENDRTDIGSSIPWLNYGLNLAAYYRDFDLQLFFQGAGGNKIYNMKRSYLESDGSTSILSNDMKNVWSVNNPDGDIPNPKNSINSRVSTRFLENGDYFRLKNIQIGYSLPRKLLGKAGFKSCRFYLQASNLFTITKYKGYDPEVNGGVDYGNYPQSRTFLIGVNLAY